MRTETGVPSALRLGLSAADLIIWTCANERTREACSAGVPLYALVASEDAGVCGLLLCLRDLVYRSGSHQEDDDGDDKADDITRNFATVVFKYHGLSYITNSL